MKNISQALLTSLSSSWLGWGAYFGFFITFLAGFPEMASPVMVAVPAVLACVCAVLFMNGMAQLKFILPATKSFKWFRKHKALQMLFRWTEDGVKAGILLAVLILLAYVLGGDMVKALAAVQNVPVANALTLFGVMSAAVLASRHIMPVFTTIENVSGKFGVLLWGSFLAGVTSGPVMALLLANYFKDRIKMGESWRVGPGLSATIGVGSGSTWIAAPPILIIATQLQTEMQLTLWDMLFFIGFPSIFFIAVASMLFAPYIEDLPREDHTAAKTDVADETLVEKLKREILEMKDKIAATKYLGIMGALVAAHLIAWEYVVYMDLLVGLMALYVGLREYLRGYGNENVIEKQLMRQKQGEAIDLERLKAQKEANKAIVKKTLQPLELTLLLVGLDIVGGAIEPFIKVLSGFIPSGMGLISLMFLLFTVSMLVSHFAANSLATRMFIVVPVSLLGGGIISLEEAQVLSFAIIYGAIGGGFPLISAYLANFPIAKILNINPKDWLNGGLRMYPSVLALIAILVVIAQVFVGG